MAHYPSMNLARLQRWWSNHSHAPTALAIKHIEQCDSTNAQLYRSPSQHNTLLITETQTHGRGQFDRTWQSQNGDLIFSLGLQLPTNRIPALSLRVGLALAKVCHAHHWVVQLKWPNDVILSEGKLAGILVQTRPSEHTNNHWAVIGVGINIASRAHEYTSATFAPTGLAQSDEQWLPKQVREGMREALLLQIVDEILLHIDAVQGLPDPKLAQQWNAYDLWQDKMIRWTDPNHEASLIGAARGINAQGAYQLYDGHATHLLHNGQIRLAPSAS